MQLVRVSENQAHISSVLWLSLLVSWSCCAEPCIKAGGVRAPRGEIPEPAPIAQSKQHPVASMQCSAWAKSPSGAWIDTTVLRDLSYPGSLHMMDAQGPYLEEVAEAIISDSSTLKTGSHLFPVPNRNSSRSCFFIWEAACISKRKRRTALVQLVFGFLGFFFSWCLLLKQE